MNKYVLFSCLDKYPLKTTRMARCQLHSQTPWSSAPEPGSEESQAWASSPWRGHLGSCVWSLPHGQWPYVRMHLHRQPPRGLLWCVKPQRSSCPSRQPSKDAGSSRAQSGPDIWPESPTQAGCQAESGPECPPSCPWVLWRSQKAVGSTGTEPRFLSHASALGSKRLELTSATALRVTM